MPAATKKEIEEYNGWMLKRQENFRIAANYIGETARQINGVERMAIIGSVASPLELEYPRWRSFRQAGTRVYHECSDLDLAAWVSDLECLRALQKARAQGLNLVNSERGITFAHHQVDVFIFEPGTDKYLGRLCTFTSCPKDKDECMVPRCGKVKLLRQFRAFKFRPEALQPHKTMLLFDKRERTMSMQDKVKEFVAPYYREKDQMHDMSHQADQCISGTCRKI